MLQVGTIISWVCSPLSCHRTYSGPERPRASIIPSIGLEVSFISARRDILAKCLVARKSSQLLHPLDATRLHPELCTHVIIGRPRLPLMPWKWTMEYNSSNVDREDQAISAIRDISFRIHTMKLFCMSGLISTVAKMYQAATLSLFSFHLQWQHHFPTIDSGMGTNSHHSTLTRRTKYEAPIRKSKSSNRRYAWQSLVYMESK